jgi:hypothetical protein
MRVLAIVAAIPGFCIAAGPPLVLEKSIPLPRVHGRIDHMSIDRAGRLFVSALGNNSLEVIDTKAGALLRSVPDLHEPQGVLFLQDFGKVGVASAEDGGYRAFDAESLKLVRAIKLGDDADNVRYDARDRRVYVGYGAGALAIIDPASGAHQGDIPLDGHPESFQIERSGPRIFVNVPAARHIAVVDRQKRSVVARWAVTAAADNFPMGLNEADARLFIACRKPPKLLVYDTGSGKKVAELAVVGDADDLFYDRESRRVYVIGGQGAVSVVAVNGPGQYVESARIPTAPGARTGLFAPELKRLFVAVPRRTNQAGEIRVFSTGR